MISENQLSSQISPLFRRQIPLLQARPGRRPAVAIFLSGSGSNAERILEACREAGEKAPFRPVAIVTDAPETSRAGELAANYRLPLVENDIRKFYRSRGETRVSLSTEGGRRARAEWTARLREQLAAFEVDFGILAGFVPLTNITDDFPCLNVHPGDLTYEKGGRRWLVGLHTVPVERAILEGLDSLRSSVILAQSYTAGGDNMDSGPILGLSEPVPIDLRGHSLEQLEECLRQRPKCRPKGGFGDILEELAREHLQRLKVEGDWRVFPPAVFDFARGRYALDQDGGLLFRLGGRRHPVATVVYGEQGREVIFR